MVSRREFLIRSAAGLQALAASAPKAAFSLHHRVAHLADPDAAGYDQPFRPQFHFSPPRNWMNDPNGLVFYRGEYHLFFQYNPFGNEWGHMSWGHAVSRDMLHWRDLPVALAEENGIMIFSGSAVVYNDRLVAIYTGHTPERQTQNIAFSGDGVRWTKYKGNPVIDLGMKDFRDPKVFRHEASKKWIMTVA